MDQIKISVIITNYNYARYLEQCISSTMKSDFDHNRLEIIVVDDASTDESVEIAGQMIPGLDIPVRILKNDTNLQLIRSRNRGIVNARGEFIFILDADNYIGTDCLTKHYETMTANPDWTACYAPIQNFDDKTGLNTGLRSDKPFNYDQLLDGNYIDGMAMFRRKDIMEAGMYSLYLPPDIWEDYELWLRLGKAGKKIGFIEGKPLSFYRTHENSKLSTVKAKTYVIVTEYLKMHYPLKYSCSIGDNEEVVWLSTKKYCRFFYEGEETGSLTKEISPETRVIRFPLEGKKLIRFLRFDPINDYATIRIKSIRLYMNGELVNPELFVTSNAVITEGNTWFFDHQDPQILYDMTKLVEFEQIEFEVDFLETGINVLKTIWKTKNQG